VPLKIMFRGDNRHPTNNNIFADGFNKRDAAYPAPQYAPNVQRHRAGDLVSQSGISLSSRFSGAALFPLRFNFIEPNIHSFIYVVCVESRELLNTHALQVRDALGNIVDGRWQNPHAAANQVWGLNAPMWPLFAHEMAANAVPSGQIISAVACTRTWNGVTWQTGGTYRLGNIFHNPACTAPGEIVRVARTFLQDEVNNRPHDTLPNGGGGYSLGHLQAAEP